MATGTSNGGDVILGGRQLAGVFAVLVLLLGAVFTLGYFLGRGDYELPLRASASTTASVSGDSAAAKSVAAKPAAAARPNADTPAAQTTSRTDSGPWNLFRSTESAQPAQRLTTPAKAVATGKNPTAAPAVEKISPAAEPAGAGSASRNGPNVAAKSSGPLNGPLIPGGAMVLQVAAVTRQGDALALAQALQKKKFPAFVLNPTSDQFYRVQVGPYANAKATAAARTQLESQGFNSIVKR